MNQRRFPLFDAFKWAGNTLLDNFELLFKAHLSLILSFLSIFLVLAPFACFAFTNHPIWGKFCLAIVPALQTVIGCALLVVLFVFSCMLSLWIATGYMKMLLSLYDQGKATFATLFSATFTTALKMSIATLCLALLSFFGLVFFVIPGLYVTCTYLFAPWFVIDKDLGITEAFRESARITRGVRWQIFGFILFVLSLRFVSGALINLAWMPFMLLVKLYLFKALQSTAEKRETITASV